MGTSSPTRSNRTLVMGLGNKVMTDDAAGLVALQRFEERYKTDDAVDYMDGGTLGLELLVYMEGYGSVLIPDCLMSGRTPGEVRIVDEGEVDTVFERCLSPHQMGIKDLLAVLRLQDRVPENFKVIGIEGESIELGTELTPDVAASIEQVVEAMAVTLREWGHEVSEA